MKSDPQFRIPYLIKNGRTALGVARECTYGRLGCVPMTYRRSCIGPSLDATSGCIAWPLLTSPLCLQVVASTRPPTLSPTVVPTLAPTLLPTVRRHALQRMGRRRAEEGSELVVGMGWTESTLCLIQSFTSMRSLYTCTRVAPPS